MHGGESETSILLHYQPDYVGPDWQEADHQADDRPDLLLLGMSGYTKTGIIGRPSLAAAAKGEALVQALVAGSAWFERWIRLPLRSRWRHWSIYRYKWPATMDFAELNRYRSNGTQYERTGPAQRQVDS
jgi:hypothetical protein